VTQAAEGIFSEVVTGIGVVTAERSGAGRGLVFQPGRVLWDSYTEVEFIVLYRGVRVMLQRHMCRPVVELSHITGSKPRHRRGLPNFPVMIGKLTCQFCFIVYAPEGY
jgi:hypothetical protein